MTVTEPRRNQKGYTIFMKQLLAGLGIILVIGIAGFSYRLIIERPQNQLVGQACTQEAKVCPDGSSVGRTGPSCEFAACPTTRVTLGTFSFEAPEGYVRDSALPDQYHKTVLFQFEKSSVSSTSVDSIVVQQLGRNGDGSGKVEEDIVNATRFSPSDMKATSINQFKKVTIAGHLFYSILIERFEGVVHSAYYFPSSQDGKFTDLYLFEVIEHDVDWTNPKLDIDALPAHKALRSMLETLEVQ